MYSKHFRAIELLQIGIVNTGTKEDCRESQLGSAWMEQKILGPHAGQIPMWPFCWLAGSQCGLQ